MDPMVEVENICAVSDETVPEFTERLQREMDHRLKLFKRQQARDFKVRKEYEQHYMNKLIQCEETLRNQRYEELGGMCLVKRVDENDN